MILYVKQTRKEPTRKGDERTTMQQSDNKGGRAGEIYKSHSLMTLFFTSSIYRHAAVVSFPGSWNTHMVVNVYWTNTIIYSGLGWNGWGLGRHFNTRIRERWNLWKRKERIKRDEKEALIPRIVSISLSFPWVNWFALFLGAQPSPSSAFFLVLSSAFHIT